MCEQKGPNQCLEMPNVPNTPTVALLIEYSRSHRYARCVDTYWHGVSVGLGTALRIMGVSDDVRDGFEALWRRCFERFEVSSADITCSFRDLQRDIEDSGADLDAEEEKNG